MGREERLVEASGVLIEGDERSALIRVVANPHSHLLLWPCGDPNAEAARLVGLGAKVAADEYSNFRYVLLSAPDSHTLRLVPQNEGAAEIVYRLRVSPLNEAKFFRAASEFIDRLEEYPAISIHGRLLQPVLGDSPPHTWEIRIELDFLSDLGAVLEILSTPADGQKFPLAAINELETRGGAELVEVGAVPIYRCWRARTRGST